MKRIFNSDTLGRFAQAGVLAAAVAATGSAGAADFDEVWTTVGSTGAIDEYDLDKYYVSGPTLSVAGTSDTYRSVRARYNVTAVDGLFAGGDGYSMEAWIGDTGDGSRVLVRLYEYDTRTNRTRNLMTINSDNYGTSYGNMRTFDCSPSGYFDFVNKVYYVDVVMTEYNSQNASLSSIRIGPNIC